MIRACTSDRFPIAAPPVVFSPLPMQILNPTTSLTALTLPRRHDTHITGTRSR